MTIILLFLGFDRNDRKLLKREREGTGLGHTICQNSHELMYEVLHKLLLRCDKRCNILNNFTHCIAVSRPRHTQHVNTFIKFHTQLPLSALCRNNGHPRTHTDTECLSLVIMGASNTLSFSLFKSITNLSVTIFSYKVYFLHRWIKPQPAHTQATWLPAVWLTARRPKVNVFGGMQCFSTVVGCIHYKEKAHPPPISFETHKKREKRQWRGKLERCLDRWPLCIFFSSVNWSPFSDEE